MKKLGKLKIVAYVFIAFLILLTAYALYEGIMTDTSGFGGLGYSIGAAFLQIPISIANDISGAIQSFGKLVELYLDPANW